MTQADEMTPEARAAKARYNREWRAKHPEKQRIYNARHWQKVADAAKDADQENDQEHETEND